MKERPEKTELEIEKTVADEKSEKKEKKGAKAANIVINVILVAAILIAAFCTYVSFVTSSGNGVPSIFGIEIFSVQTPSMRPTIKEGDLIFDTKVKDASLLKKGDVITYWTVIDGERVLNTHRIVEVYDLGDHFVFQTKGDNNDAEDAQQVHEASVVGKYTEKKIDGAGKIFDFLQTSKGFLIVVVIPVALFFIFHLIQFFRVLFEYQKVKNRLAFEQEKMETDGKGETAPEEDEHEEEKKKLEEELREKLKRELLEEQKKAEEAKAEEEAKAAADRAALEAELRSKILKEMEEEKAGTDTGNAGPSENGDDAG